MLRSAGVHGPDSELVVLRSLCLPEADVRRIANTLAARMKEDLPKSPRAQRHAYRVRGGIGLVLHPESAQRLRYRVDPIDLSATGVGLMHNHFVYQGTRCELYLVTRDSELLRVSGKITRCDCFCAPVHILGVHFDAPLDVTDFLPMEQPPVPQPAVAAPCGNTSIPQSPAGVDVEKLRAAFNELGVLIHSGANVDQLRKCYEQICRRLSSGHACRAAAR